MKFSCQFDCGYSTISYKWMIKHIWNFHSILDEYPVLGDQMQVCSVCYWNCHPTNKHLPDLNSDFSNNFSKVFMNFQSYIFQIVCNFSIQVMDEFKRVTEIDLPQCWNDYFTLKNKIILGFQPPKIFGKPLWKW